MKFSNIIFASLSIALFGIPPSSPSPLPAPVPFPSHSPYGEPNGPGKFSIHDINAFMDQVPDEVLDLARQTFPGMTDAEIMMVLLEGSEEDMQSMVANAVGERVPEVRGQKGKIIPPPGKRKMEKPRLREVPSGSGQVQVVATDGKVELQKPKEETKKHPHAEITQFAIPTIVKSVQVKPTTTAVPAPPPSSPAAAAVPLPRERYDSLAEELAHMTPADKLEVQLFMASIGLPDITQGLPADFDPASYPPEIQELAEMLIEQLGTPGQNTLQAQEEPQEVFLDSSNLTPEQIEAIWAIIDGKIPPSEDTQQQSPPKPTTSHKAPKATPFRSPKKQSPSSFSDSEPPYDLPPDIRTLIPPRPLTDIPHYPANQLSTPHNPLYTYDLSLLNHVDPYHTLDSTHPHADTHHISRLPPLPDAHTRYQINNPTCTPPTSSPSTAGPPKFTDCSRAVSNILPSQTAQTCEETRSWKVTRQIVSEFGTCRVVVRNEAGQAGCVELEKVKHLAGRVLRECGEGVMRDRRLRTVEGKVGYLFVDGEGRWDTMWVGLERASFE